jgi:sugar phosphate isomerase/epimerase
MKRGIVGYTGFVGSNLLQFYKFDSFFNSKNFHEAKNMYFDELYFVGIPAVKWYANKFPEEDNTIINNIKSILETIQVKKIILISTIDVYEYVDSKFDEDYDCDIFNNHTYGVNRYLFEDFVKKQFDNYHIIRLPALFGKGLKKNIIYDLMNKNQIENISKDCFFQWYDLNWLKNDIEIVVKNNIQICNLFTEPLSSLEIIKLFDYPMEEFKNKSQIIYNTKTKYSKLFESSAEGYIRDKSSVLHNLRLFLNFQKIDKSSLVVSNICVKNTSQLQFACLLKLYGIRNVQIAPTTLINSWDNLSLMNLDVFKNNDINVYSFQSITYGLNDLNIFDTNATTNTNEILLNHLKKIIDYGILNNISILVFGCPKNRRILNVDDDNNNNNDEIFCSFFQKLGDYIGNNKLKICIEPNSKQYGCNFINTIKEAGELIKKIDNKNIKMMVDIGNMMMDKDELTDIYNYKEYIYNIDVSNENMKPFLNIKQQHKDFISVLKNVNYKNKINLEMLISDNDKENELSILCESLNNFINLQM